MVDVRKLARIAVNNAAQNGINAVKNGSGGAAYNAGQNVVFPQPVQQYQPQPTPVQNLAQAALNRVLAAPSPSYQPPAASGLAGGLGSSLTSPFTAGGMQNPLMPFPQSAPNPFAAIVDNARSNALTAALSVANEIQLRNQAAAPIAAPLATPFQAEEANDPWQVYEVPGQGPVAVPASYTVPTDWTAKGDPLTDPVKIDRAKNSNISWDRQEDDIKSQVRTPDQSYSDDMVAMQNEAAAEVPKDRAAVTKLQGWLAGQRARDEQQIQGENALQRLPDAAAATKVQKQNSPSVQSTNTNANVGSLQGNPDYLLVSNNQSGEQMVVRRTDWDRLPNKGDFTVLSSGLDERTAQRVSESTDNQRTTTDTVGLAERQAGERQSENDGAPRIQSVQKTSTGDVIGNLAPDPNNQMLVQKDGRNYVVTADEWRGMDKGGYTVISDAMDPETADRVKAAIPDYTQPRITPVTEEQRQYIDRQSETAAARAQQITATTKQEDIWREAITPDSNVGLGAASGTSDMPMSVAADRQPGGSFVVVRNNDSGEEITLPIEVYRNARNPGNYTLVRTNVNAEGVPDLLVQQATENGTPLKGSDYDDPWSLVQGDYADDIGELGSDLWKPIGAGIGAIGDLAKNPGIIKDQITKLYEDPVGFAKGLIPSPDMATGALGYVVEVVGDVWNAVLPPVVEDIVGDTFQLIMNHPAEWTKDTLTDIAFKIVREEDLTPFEQLMSGVFMLAQVYTGEPTAHVTGLSDAANVVYEVLAPISYPNWIIQHPDEAEAAYAEGGTDAVWEIYQADVTDWGGGWGGTVVRGVRDMTMDPWTYVPLFGLGAKAAKEGLLLRALDPEAGAVSSRIFRGGATVAGGIEKAAEISEILGNAGTDYALKGISVLGERTGLTRKTSENVLGTNTTEAQAAAEGVDRRRNVVRENGEPGIGILDETTPLRSTTDTVGISERQASENPDTPGVNARIPDEPRALSASSAGRRVSADEVPTRWRPREDGDNFISTIERENPVLGQELRSEMLPTWNQEVRAQRRIQSGNATPDNILITSRVANETIDTARQLDPSYTLPEYVSGDQVAMPPFSLATERVLRLPWDETGGMRRYLYSGDAANFPEGRVAGYSGYRGRTITTSLPASGTGRQFEIAVEGANRYVDMVEQHALWVPSDFRSRGFQDAWKAAVKIDSRLREADLRTPIGGEYRSSGSVPLANLPLSRQLGISPIEAPGSSVRGAIDPIRGVTPSPSDVSPQAATGGVPYRLADEWEGDVGTGKTYEIDSDTVVEVQPIRGRDVSARDRARHPEASIRTPWYEAVVKGDGATEIPVNERTAIAPDEDLAVERAVQIAVDKGLIDESQLPLDTTTTASVPSEYPQKLTRAMTGSDPQVTAPAASGAAPEKSPAWSKDAQVRGQQTVKDANGIDIQRRVVKVAGVGDRYLIEAPLNAKEAASLWTARRPDGSVLRANVSLEDARQFIDVEAKRVSRQIYEPTMTGVNTPVSKRDPSPARGDRSRIKSATVLTGDPPMRTYDLVVNSVTGDVWLWDTLLAPSEVEMMTRYVFANGETYLDRLVRYKQELADRNPTWFDSDAQNRAMEQVRHDADGVLTARIPERAKNRFLRGFDTFTRYRRERMLASWLKAVTYPTTQAMGNLLQLAITGKLDAIPNYLAEAAPFKGRVRRGVIESLSPEELWNLDKKNVPVAMQLDNELGLVPDQRVVDGYKKSKFGNDSIDKDLVITQFLGRLHPSLEGFGKLFGSQWVMRQGQVWDTAMRSAVYTRELIRGLRPAIVDFKIGAFDLMDKAGIERAERSRIWNDFETNVVSKRGTFSAADAQTYFEEHIGRGSSMRLSRDWQQSMLDLRKKVNSELDRVTFSGGDVNADKLLSRVLVFHYFQSRQSWLYLTTLAKHPFMVHLYQRYMEAVDRDKLEGAPWMKGWFEFMSGPFGMAAFVNPVAMLTSYATFRNDADGWDDATVSKAGGIFNLVDKYLGINPVIKDVANMAGLLGEDAMTPDLLGIYNESDIATDLWNVSIALGLNSGKPQGNKVTQWMEDLREASTSVTSQVIPGSVAIKADDVQGQVDRQIRLIATDEAEKQGLDLDDPEDRAVFDAAMADPNSDIYQAAMKRYVLGETAKDALRLSPLGPILRPQLRTVATAGERTGEDLSLSRTQNEKSIANTADPAAIKLKTQADGYYNITEDPDTNSIVSIHDDIAYGTPIYPITVKGKKYTPKEIMAMSDDERKLLADTYLEGYQLQDRYYDIKEKQAAYLEDPANKEYNQQREWSKGVRAYDGGVDGYWSEVIEANPNAREYYEYVKGQNLTPEEEANRLTGMTAWMYVNGIQPTVYDGKPKDTNVRDGGPSDPTGIAGTAPKPAEPYVSDFEVNLRKGLPEYYTDMSVWDDEVSAQQAEMGIDPSVPFNELDYKTRISIEDGLEEKGIYRPKQPMEVGQYIEWAEQQPEGADVSVDAYLAADKEEYRRNVGGRLEEEQDTTYDPPEDSNTLWKDILELINEHDYNRYPKN